MFTHPGVTSSWNCPPQTWFEMQSQLCGKGEKVIKDNSGVLDIGCVEQVYLGPLLLESIRLSQDLRRGVGYINGEFAYVEDFRMARNAFTPFPKSRSPASSEFLHRFHRPVTLDRFMDAFLCSERMFTPRNTQYLDKVRQTAMIADIDMKVPKGFWDAEDMNKEWHLVAQNFFNDYETQISYRSVTNTTEPGRRIESSVASCVVKPNVSSKLKLARDAMIRDGAVKLVFGNILDCALGIHEIVRVSAHFDVTTSFHSRIISVFKDLRRNG